MGTDVLHRSVRNKTQASPTIVEDREMEGLRMASEKVPSAKVAPVVNDARPHDATLLGAWEEHIGSEFAAKSPDQAIATMAEDPYVNTVALMIGGRGRDEVRAFYADHFLSQIPPDTEMVPVSRTVGQGRVVDEFVVRFTHTIRMDWILPGVPPTGRRVELPVVVVVQFDGDKIAHEHIYWDQASVLVQVGLLDRSLPVLGGETAAQVLDPTRPMNELIPRASPA